MAQKYSRGSFEHRGIDSSIYRILIQNSVRAVANVAIRGVNRPPREENFSTRKNEFKVVQRAAPGLVSKRLV
jgi:hypothetical protein